MAIILPMQSPWVRHEDPETDIFGPSIVLEHDGGFAKLTADEVQKVIILNKNNTAEIHFKNGDITTCHEFSGHDFNEFLCWVTINKLKAE